MPYTNTASTVRLQRIVNLAKARGDINPVLNLPASDTTVPLAIANDAMNDICSLPFPQKWNEMIIPPFYTSSFQQDYAGIYPNGSSITNLSWLERGIVVDINNDAQPKPYEPLEVGRQLPQATGTFWNSATNNPLFLVNYYPNNTLYYGTWGAANNGTGSLGNNPTPGSTYTFPLGVNSQPANPITQIQDANGNFLVLTTYGTTGGVAPVLPALSTPGTTIPDGSCVWTVVDPNGQGFRIVPVPSSTGLVWQFNLVGQMLPVRFTNLQQTLAPLPDQYEPNFRQIFIARCYQYSPESGIRAKFKDEHALAMEALVNCMKKSDRETEENIFTPDRSIMSGGQRGGRRFGPQFPFNYSGQ
jgi:hypothetical protein